MEFELSKKCVELKIVLDRFCESFNEEKSGRICDISSSFKILMLVKQGKNTPKELIDCLAIAKSNITILCDRLVNTKKMNKIKAEGNRKNITYSLTEKGEREIEEVLTRLGGCYPNINELPNLDEIEYKIEELTNFLHIAMGEEDVKNI